jgi:hypothetical protein
VIIKFKKGIEDKQIDQLIEYSLTDEAVGKFTHDKERFGSREAFDEWLKKGREITVMTNNNGDLLGIFWDGTKEMPSGDKKYNKTFGIRIYGEARGKGLSLGFMQKCIKEKGYWLETNDKNVVAKKLYAKFGFKQVGGPDEKDEIVMVY